MLDLIIHTVAVLVLILWEIKNLELRYINYKEFIDNFTAVIIIGVSVFKITLILLAAYLI